MDPGRKRDAFAILSASCTQHNIDLLHAKDWTNKDFISVGQEIAELHKVAKWDVFLCESNNQGHPMIDILRREHNIYCVPIATVKDLKNKEKMRAGNTMPKNVTVEWVEWARQKEILRNPKQPWPRGIKKLNAQLSRYVRIVTDTTMRYGVAEEDDHDDYISALLTLCHYARLKYLRIGYLNSNVLTGRRFPNALSLGKTKVEKARENVLHRISKKYPNSSNVNVDVRMPND